jgi:hypothetical protein
LSLEEVDKLFSMAFARVCALKEVQRLGPSSFVQTVRASTGEQEQIRLFLTSVTLESWHDNREKLILFEQSVICLFNGCWRE